MDATKAIQIAVARADLFICRARTSTLWALAAVLIVGAALYINIKGEHHK